MSQPSTLPTWDSTAVNITTPGSEQTNGWAPTQAPSAEVFNWFFYWVYRWLYYLQHITTEALTWTAAHAFNGGLSASSATVSGTLGVTGASTLGSVSATSATVSGTLAVTGASTLGSLSATSATVYGPLSTAGAATLGGVDSHGATVVGPLAVTGATTTRAITATETSGTSLTAAVSTGTGLVVTKSGSGGPAVTVSASNAQGMSISTAGDTALQLESTTGLGLTITGNIVKGHLRLVNIGNDLPSAAPNGTFTVVGDHLWFMKAGGWVDLTP